MELNSLPDEMLLSILKYANVDFIRNLRTINQRFNQLAKRADISIGVPVNNFSFDGEHSFFARLSVAGQAGRLPVSQHFFLPLDKINQDSCLSNVKILNLLKISQCAFDDAFLAVMRKYRSCLRSLKKIAFFDVDFMVNANDAKEFFQGLSPKLESLEIFYSKEFENICLYELIGCRNWKCMSITGHLSKHIDLNDKFLLEIAPKCQQFFCLCLFTVSGAIKMLKKCLADNKFSHEIYLSFLKLEDVHLSDVDQLFRTELLDLHISKTPHSSCIEYMVWIDQCSRTHWMKFHLDSK